MPEMTSHGRALVAYYNGVRRRKTQIFGTEGRGFESCKVFFFFLLFLFFFFFFVSNPEPFLEPFLFSVFLFGLK